MYPLVLWRIKCQKSELVRVVSRKRGMGSKQPFHEISVGRPIILIMALNTFNKRTLIEYPAFNENNLRLGISISGHKYGFYWSLCICVGSNMHIYCLKVSKIIRTEGSWKKLLSSPDFKYFKYQNDGHYNLYISTTVFGWCSSFFRNNNAIWHLTVTFSNQFWNYLPLTNSSTIFFYIGFLVKQINFTNLCQHPTTLLTRFHLLASLFMVLDTI